MQTGMLRYRTAEKPDEARAKFYRKENTGRGACQKWVGEANESILLRYKVML